MGSNDLNVVYRPCKIDEMVGNETNRKLIKNALGSGRTPHTQLFTGDAGCVDRDTEFLSTTGWKKICNYSEGDKVMQYNVDGTSNFVEPMAYIKNKSDTMNVIQTKYGVDQCLSNDHRVVYFSTKKELIEDSFEKIKIKHNNLKMGFTGKFKTTFSPVLSTKIHLTDAELRVQVMVIADSNLPPVRKKCCVRTKKQRKINRAQLLLESAGIKYDRYENNDGYTRFYFVPPIHCKEFGVGFYKCSTEQLIIISGEVLNWDGSKKYRQFWSTSKASADFIQYVFASVGTRSTIYYDEHRKNTCYVVSLSDNVYVGIKGNAEGKPQIKEYKTIDGYEYCFKVPSSYLVLRRNDRIFITGNCGKTTAAKIIALGLNCEENGVSSNPCLECKSCRAILEGNSLDVKEINVGQSGGKDYVSAIVNDLPMAPFSARYKVLIFDEAHELTAAAKDLLLKPIENGYEHVYFIFCTNQADKLRSKKKGVGEAFLDRCSILNFGRQNIELIRKLLQNVCEFEGFQFNTDVLDLIAEESRGVPRNALVWLNQTALEGSWLISAAKEICEVAADVEDPQVYELCKLLNKGSFKDTVKIFESIKTIPIENLRIPIAGYFVACLKRSRKVGDARKYSNILDLVETPIYEQGKQALPKWINIMFKITDIINTVGRT